MRQVLWIGMFFIAFGLYAQKQGSISGQILDKEMNLEPLYHAEVVLKSNGKIVKTNFMGNFSFNNLAVGKDTLEVRYPGYATSEIPIRIGGDGSESIQYALEAMTIDMEDMKELLLKATTSGQKE